MEFQIKIWKNFRYKKRLLVIRQDDFQIKKIVDEKKKKKKNDEIQTYSLTDAIILDQTKKNDLEIFIATKDYKITITPSNIEDKVKIINNIEKIIKRFTFQNVFKDYNEKMSQYNDKENEISPQDFLTARLFLFKNLMNEMNQKIEELKPNIKQKPKSKTDSEILRIYTNIKSLKEEMEVQFQVILTYTNNYFVITEKDRKGSMKRINTLLSAMKKEEKIKEKENELSSDDEQNLKNLNIDNIKNEQNQKTIV